MRGVRVQQMHVDFIIEIEGQPYSKCGHCGSYVDPQIHLCPEKAVDDAWEKVKDFDGPVS
mgnify:CR=1 FL=1